MLEKFYHTFVIGRQLYFTKPKQRSFFEFFFRFSKNISKRNSKMNIKKEQIVLPSFLFLNSYHNFSHIYHLFTYINNHDTNSLFIYSISLKNMTSIILTYCCNASNIDFQNNNILLIKV